MLYLKDESRTVAFNCIAIAYKLFFWIKNRKVEAGVLRIIKIELLAFIGVLRVISIELLAFVDELRAIACALLAFVSVLRAINIELLAFAYVLRVGICEWHVIVCV